jgi:hypothetical protein
MSADAGDRAEPCERTKTGTSSERWKTARWKRAGPEEVRAALRVGREVTCDEYASYQGGSKEFSLSSLSMNNRLGGPSLLDY